MGRPTKMEGNPEHPGSLGGTDVFTQALDSEHVRPRSLASRPQRRPREHLGGFCRRDGQHSRRNVDEGRGNPAARRRRLRRRRSARKYTRSSRNSRKRSGISTSRARAIPFARARASRSAKSVNTVYHFDQADVIVSLDADFLINGPGHARYAREFASRRDLAAGADSKLNRLYVVESMATSTGVVSDHRLPLRSSDIEVFARQLAAAAGVSVPQSSNTSVKIPSDWVERRRARSRRASRVVAGYRRRKSAACRSRSRARDECGARQRRQDGDVHRIDRSRIQSIRWPRCSDLVNDLNAGKVDLLVILGGESRIRRAGRFQFREHVNEGEDARSFRALQRRNRRAVPLARAGRALSWNPGATRAPTTAPRASSSR